jgi:orotidine-5'-phosphate decarboxylase
MNINQLKNKIKEKKSYLCVGLDPDVDRIPTGTTIVDFCFQIIDQTLPYAVSYKINTAFFESMGWRGFKIMSNIVDYLNKKDVFIICDAKRGDIGNTSKYYAKAFFEEYNFDALTVNPYMGYDSLKPFFDYTDKTTIILALTSNESSDDFQTNKLFTGDTLFETIIRTSKNWKSKGDKMWVIGATKSTYLSDIRKILKDDFLLVPGIGTQGGNLREVSKKLLTKDCGILVNMSRSILYAENPGMVASDIQKEMEIYLCQSIKEKEDIQLDVMNN